MQDELCTQIEEVIRKNIDETLHWVNAPARETMTKAMCKDIKEVIKTSELNNILDKTIS